MSTHKQLTRQVKIALSNPRKLARLLELDRVSEKQARGIIVQCPAHEDRGRPNLSITTAPDGTVRAKCHACQFTGDALTLIAKVYGLDLAHGFKEVLMIGAELSGDTRLRDEISDGKPRPDRIPLPEPRKETPADWPKGASDFWEWCLRVDRDQESCRMLESRGFDVDRIAALNLARVVPGSGNLPRWARFGQRDWRATGHRLIIRAFDAAGELRSVRAWRVREGDSPKRLPPAGCRSAGLVLADRAGWRLMRGECAPFVLFVVEGEPDWLAASLAAPGGFGVWGVGSGSWTDEHATVAQGVRRVVVGTHPDDAGDRYAKLVTDSVRRSERWRPPSDLDETGRGLQALMGSAARWLFVPHFLGE